MNILNQIQLPLFLKILQVWSTINSLQFQLRFYFRKNSSVLRINLSRGRKGYFFSPFPFLYYPYRGNPLPLLTLCWTRLWKTKLMYFIAGQYLMIIKLFRMIWKVARSCYLKLRQWLDIVFRVDYTSRFMLPQIKSRS